MTVPRMVTMELYAAGHQAVPGEDDLLEVGAERAVSDRSGDADEAVLGPDRWFGCTIRDSAMTIIRRMPQ